MDKQQLEKHWKKHDVSPVLIGKNKSKSATFNLQAHDTQIREDLLREILNDLDKLQKYFVKRFYPLSLKKDPEIDKLYLDIYAEIQQVASKYGIKI